MTWHRIGSTALTAALVLLGVATGIVVHRLWEFRNGVEQLADELTLDAGLRVS